jgi:hypothetical protein
MDTISVRAMVHGREEETQEGSSGQDPSANPAISTASDDSVDTANTDTVEIDPLVYEAPMMLLGSRKNANSKEKVFRLDKAMESMGASFLFATIKDTAGNAIYPCKLELHRVACGSDQNVTSYIENEFSGPEGLLDLVKKCWQVVRTKSSDESVKEVCLYLRIDPTVSVGAKGDVAKCKNFEAMRKEHYDDQAALVIALDKKLAENISNDQEASKLLHPTIANCLLPKAASRPKKRGEKVSYAKFDDIAANGENEHDSFLFKLAAKATSGGAATSATAAKAGSSGKQAAAAASSARRKSVTAANDAEDEQAKTASNKNMQVQPTITASMKTSPNVEDGGSANVVEEENTNDKQQVSFNSQSDGNSSALVVRSSERIRVERVRMEDADEAQRLKWMAVGYELCANGGVIDSGVPYVPKAIVCDLQDIRMTAEKIPNHPSKYILQLFGQ